MIKNFNSVPMLKSSGNCDKFSTSVSYETLVIDATTTGSECGEALEIEGVITRRTLVRRGYLPEQGTHANKESLFASVTCFMRLPRRIQRMLLVMTIPTLALLFTIATTAESSAESWNCGPEINGEYNNSVMCTYDEKSKTLTIEGEGNMGNYERNPSPWISKEILHAVIKGNVTSIGYNAFVSSGLTSITIPNSVTSIEEGAFYDTKSLKSITIPEGVTTIGVYAFGKTGLTSITLPDSVTEIGKNAFRDATSLTSITIPDNINTEGWNSSAFRNLPEGTNIVCQGGLNTCYEKLAKYFTSETCPQNLKDAGKGNLCNCSKYCIDSSRISEATQNQCGGKYTWDETSNPKCRHMTDNECANSAQYYINNGQCKSMPSSKTTCKNADLLWSGSSCVKSCASGFVEWDNQCLDEYPFAKKRWTPAEANQWLHDGNDNFVVITFKK